MPQGAEKLQQETLHRVLAVARQLSASADLRQILSVIIDAMRDLLDAERATVYEYDPARDELFTTVAHGVAAGPGAAEAEIAEIRVPTSKGLCGESARTKKIINVPDAHADARFNPEIDRQTGFRTRSLLTIPLLGHDGELVGMAQVLNRRGGPFDENDEEIAAALAAQAAVALKRGRLIEDRVIREKLEHDLDLARRIQQNSFPSTLPVLKGFEIEAWSEPAEETGGDTYDVIGFATECAEALLVDEPGRADRAVMLMADATGHGVGPALSVTQVRSMLRMAVRMDADLEQIALHMNEQLCHDLPEGRFITAWLGELDANRQALTSFSAGQAPILRYVAVEGCFRNLDADTIPLGIMPQAKIVIEQEFSMNPGDIFAVISDGIFEAESPDGEPFGEQRVQEVITALKDASAGRIVQALRKAVDDFTRGMPAKDDRTVILIKRLRDS
ncbi:MAG: GAF domain-containing SpoIIE family protein phosphatase [Planctomycetota bacterium]|nr:GAF domain-containing SpoIIE family protein phosphatase [Planctomycetota bacterium]